MNMYEPVFNSKSGDITNGLFETIEDLVDYADRTNATLVSESCTTEFLYGIRSGPTKYSISPVTDGTTTYWFNKDRVTNYYEVNEDDDEYDITTEVYPLTSGYAEHDYTKCFVPRDPDGLAFEIICTHSKDGVRLFRLHENNTISRVIETYRFDKWHRELSHDHSSARRIIALEEAIHNPLLTPQEAAYANLKEEFYKAMKPWTKGFISPAELAKEIYDLKDRYCNKSYMEWNSHAKEALLYPCEYEVDYDADVKRFGRLELPPSIFPALQVEKNIAKRINNVKLLGEIESLFSKLIDYRNSFCGTDQIYGKNSFIYIRYSITDMGMKVQLFDLLTKKVATIN